MPLSRPFRALRATPQSAPRVLAPPYDVVSREEAAALAAGEPWSFLHITRPEIDLPAERAADDPAVYARGAAQLERLIAEGALVRDRAEHYYLYRLEHRHHVQTGVVVAASVAAYEQGRIRRHEHTRPDKEADRVRHIEALGAQVSPVLLAYPDAPAIDALIELGTRGPALLAASDREGVRHRLWRVDDADLAAGLEAALGALPALYIADGHHRSAAAARVAARRGGAAQRPEAPWAWFLAVAFPHHELKVLDYNRLVRDLAGRTPEAFLDAVGERFELRPASEPVRPRRHAEFGMYLAGRWYRLHLKEPWLPRPDDDPVARLDVTLLHTHLIEPLLGIGDPRRDPRIDFVGGSRGLGELEHRVDSGEWAVAFSLYPTPLADVMAVADAGEVMPPKSTWFEPKLADGLVSHVID